MKNRTNIIILAVALVLLIAAIVLWVVSGPSPESMQNPSPQAASAQGTVSNISENTHTLTIQQNQAYIPVAISGNTRMFDENGNNADFSYIEKGFDIAVEGMQNQDNSIEASVVRITRAPAIVIFSPQDGQVVSDPTITVSGVARVFENSFIIRVRTSTTTVLFEKPVMTVGNDAGKFGEFNYSFTLPRNILPNSQVFIDAFEYSPKDGSQTNVATVSVFLANRQMTTLNVFFANNKLDPQISCNKVFPVQHVIPYTQAVGQAAIVELLNGPSDQETAAGYYTSVPTNAKLKSLKIQNGTAYADFDQNLDKNIGGSCRVSSIRAQITETLKQFPSIKNVIISVNGNSAEALQP